MTTPSWVGRFLWVKDHEYRADVGGCQYKVLLEEGEYRLSTFYAGDWLPLVTMSDLDMVSKYLDILSQVRSHEDGEWFQLGEARYLVQREDGKYFVRCQGPDGNLVRSGILHEFRVHADVELANMLSNKHISGEGYGLSSKRVSGGVQPNPMPNPRNFKVLAAVQCGKHCAVKVRYPGCGHYEGKKVLVFEKACSWVKRQKSLDPHFSPDSPLFARFAPTDEGWTKAMFLLSILNPGKDLVFKLMEDPVADFMCQGDKIVW